MTAAIRPDTAARPFGAHLSMRWWVPVLLTVVVVGATYALQRLFLAAAAIVEVGLWDKDPHDLTLTPLTYLATNLAIILLAPLTLVVLRLVAKTPWRSVITPVLRFSWRRLGSYTVLFAGLMIVLNLVLAVVQPSPGSAFQITGTTIALLAVVLLTTPLQAAAEEVVFRGALTAAYASWIRAARPALIIGISLSTLLFAFLHSSSDPWMLLNYLGLGASTALMAMLGRGLEASIAFHAMNNVFAMVIGSLFAFGGGISQDRSAGAAGPYMLLSILAQAVAVVLVWRIERKRNRADDSEKPVLRSTAQ
ncbi:CPBP family intramembrane glutamic endopeptidase [Brevibacterium spongiae]|uniref:CPBP family intramembrane metalloprotease n=1 Tax=Brevibacterium spongiae TaxID=2909672 RepID=A0ABY5SVM6_9MICO|nr:type II CAAX endopeptidase family protein [Brevibacterium spongiae]UVI37156.1 CPBP family intramembrane metalloprotease [Brevibacterium spongiae]